MLTEERTVYRPLEYPWAYEAFDRQSKMHWIADEIQFGDDVTDWDYNLNPEEKHLLTQLFRFFVTADVDVGRAYLEKYAPMFKAPEIRMMLSTFAAMECFDKDTELLTSKGWVKVDQITEESEVAQVNLEDNSLSFSKPTKLHKYPFKGNLHHYEGISTDICVTPGHELIGKHPSSGKVDKKKSEERRWGSNYLYPCSAPHVLSTTPSTPDVNLNRLLIAVQADGCLRGLTPSGSLSWRTVDVHVKKERKKARLVELLNACGIKYSERKQESGYSNFCFSLPENVDITQVKNLGFIDLTLTDSVCAKAYLDEIAKWDSSKNGDGYAYYNVNEEAADKVQALAVLSGCYRSTKGVNRFGGSEARLPQGTTTTNTKTCYVVSWVETSNGSWKTYPYRKEVPYENFVYCVSVPTENVVSRRNGKVAITGNCIHVDAYDSILQTVNMPDVEYKVFQEYAEMADKHEYLWQKVEGLTEKQNVAFDLAKFSAFGEGLQLFSSFVVLLSFPQRGLMKGMGKVVTFSIKDEDLHCNSMIKLFKQYREENPSIWNDDLKRAIYQCARDMVRLELNFLKLCFGNFVIEGITYEEVERFVKWLCDRRLMQLGLKPEYGDDTKNPIPWLDAVLQLQSFTNFFESQSSEYAKVGTVGDVNDLDFD